MVLTQPRYSRRNTYFLRVSIPLWFSRNGNVTQAGKAMFRFHTTMVLTQPIPPASLLGGLFSFPYHYGSHATGSLLIGGLLVLSFHTTMVLTQHIGDGWQNFGYMFPYHYGSHATVYPVAIRYCLYKFPYHYGSHATRKRSFRGRQNTCFHTTMVLTQPTGTEGTGGASFVSIPLWFSRN